MAKVLEVIFKNLVKRTCLKWKNLKNKQMENRKGAVKLNTTPFFCNSFSTNI